MHRRGIIHWTRWKLKSVCRWDYREAGVYIHAWRGQSAPCAEIKLDIGIGALLRARIRRTRYRGLLVRRGRVRIAPWSLERTRRGWSRSRGGRTRREGALPRKMTCHSRHVPSSLPSCSATKRSLLLYLLSAPFFLSISLPRSRPLYLSPFYSNLRVI